MIDEHAFQEAVRRWKDDRNPQAELPPPSAVALTKETEEWLDRASIPEDVRAFLTRHSYGVHLRIGHLAFYMVNQIEDENGDEVNLRCMHERLLIVGGGANGDPIVLDLQNGATVGFVDHELLWDEEGPPARELLVSTGLDVGTFYRCAATNDAFPVDVYEARELSAEAWAALAHP